jgi:hypothetical protein
MLRYSRNDLGCQQTVEGQVVEMCDRCFSQGNNGWAYITNCHDPLRATIYYNCTAGCGSCARSGTMNVGNCEMYEPAGHNYRVIGCGTTVHEQVWTNNGCVGTPVRVSEYKADSCTAFNPGPGSMMWACP